jgi:hypothetical protein
MPLGNFKKERLPFRIDGELPCRAESQELESICSQGVNEFKEVLAVELQISAHSIAHGIIGMDEAIDAGEIASVGDVSHAVGYGEHAGEIRRGVDLAIAGLQISTDLSSEFINGNHIRYDPAVYTCRLQSSTQQRSPQIDIWLSGEERLQLPMRIVSQGSLVDVPELLR